MPTSSAVLAAPVQRPFRPARVAFRSVPNLVVEGFRALLKPYKDRVVLCADGSAYPPDVEVVDVSRWGRTELDRRPVPWCRIALTWDDSPRSSYLAEALGASCLLPISSAPADLVTAIERVHRRGPVARQDLPEPDPSTFVSGVSLSPREASILSGICEGRSNDEIAKDMFLSINTVKTYIRTAYQKMGVTTRAQAVLWGIDHGY